MQGDSPGGFLTRPVGLGSPPVRAPTVPRAAPCFHAIHPALAREAPHPPIPAHGTPLENTVVE